MDINFAKELIENWVKHRVNYHGVDNFKLPEKDTIIHSSCYDGQIVQYTFSYCMKVIMQGLEQ